MSHTPHLSLLTTLTCLLLLLVPAVHSRPLPSSPPPLPVFDGVHNVHGFPHLVLNPFSAASDEAAEPESCEQTYGFMPCTTTVFGNLFLILVYGYLMYMSATFLMNGSEILLEILGPGIVGGLFLPILGSLSDAIIILVSGLSGSKETAQTQVSVGMGLLAGSTVLFLTVIWGSCVVAGKCDIDQQQSRAINGKNTKGFSLTGVGVSTDIWTCYAARIMAISIIPLIVVQLPQILQSKSGDRLAVLIALIISLLMLLSYCLYQVFQPWIQKRRLAYAKHKHVISGILKHLTQNALGRLMTDDGEPNIDIIKKLFHTIDVNNDEQLSEAELRALITGIRFEEIDLDRDDATAKVMEDFDTSRDGSIDIDEFIRGITKWLDVAKQVVVASAEPGPQAIKFLHDYHLHTKREHVLLGPVERSKEQSDEASEPVENPRWNSFKAVLMLLLGTCIVAVFADPLVDSVGNFSDATSIPTFFISFVALPLATSGEAFSAIMFAHRKNIRTSSLSFSQLYGSVTMNNILCLSVFLALVYTRGLTWDFSSEVLVILIVCIVMGALASFRTTFPLWASLVAFTLYPFSLALIYVLDYIFGWS